MTIVGRCCLCSAEGVNLRGYDRETGELQWETVCHNPSATYAGQVAGAVYEKANGYNLHSVKNIRVYPLGSSDNDVPSRPTAVVPGGGVTWKEVRRIVDVATGNITDTGVFDLIVMEGGVDPNNVTGGVKTYSAGSISPLKHESDGLMGEFRGDDSGRWYSSSWRPRWLFHNPDDITTRVLEYWVYPSAIDTGSYVLKVPAYGDDPEATALFLTTASADEVRDALSLLPQVESVTVTGGPLPFALLKIVITWADESLQFSAVNWTGDPAEFGHSGHMEDILTGEILDSFALKPTSTPVGSFNVVALAKSGHLMHVYNHSGYEVGGEAFVVDHSLLCRNKNNLSEGLWGKWISKTYRLRAFYLRDQLLISMGYQSQPAGDTAGHSWFQVYELSGSGTLLHHTQTGFRYPTEIWGVESSQAVVMTGHDWYKFEDDYPAPKNQGEDSVYNDSVEHLQWYADPSINNGQTAAWNLSSMLGATDDAMWRGGTPFAGVPDVDDHTVVVVNSKHQQRRVSDTVSALNYVDTFIGVAPAMFDVATQVVTWFIGMPIGYRVNDSGSTMWRVGVGISSGPSLNTDWLPYSADAAEVQAALTATFGDHNGSVLGGVGPLFVVDPEEMSARTSVTSHNYMFWQGMRVATYRTSGSANNTAAGLIRGVEKLSMHVHVRQEGAADVVKSMAKVDIASGSVLWQTEYGTASNGGGRMSPQFQHLVHEGSHLVMGSRAMSKAIL